MRFLHTADLHLGRQINDLSLMQDQEYILDRIAELADGERADAVLIAGDVYQRSSPQAEAMALFDAFVSRLVSMGKQVFIISGNHDSAQRISYFSALLRSSGVYVTEKFEGKLQCAAVRDAFGEVVVWMLPFLRPSGGQAISAGGEDRDLSGRGPGGDQKLRCGQAAEERAFGPPVYHRVRDVGVGGAGRGRTGQHRRGCV